ncbi:MAG: class I adenylate-forming enzyme family protein [Proteobacteria bacterium]|nr:class I adenylate-forming enzyme family protein [Pseudomonadota bacterium]
MTDLPHLLSGDVPRDIAVRAPTRPALIFGDEVVTYAEFDRRVNQFANGLIALSGDPIDRIAIMTPNCVEYALIHYGAARTNTVLVHLSSRFTPRELAFVLNQTKAAYLFGHAGAYAVYDQIKDELDHHPQFVGIGQGFPEGVLTYEDVVGNQPDTLPDVTIQPEDELCILYTSGTTGNPKGAVSSNRARLVASTAAAEDIPIGPDDVCAATIPLCHAAGLYSWFHPIIIGGACAVILEKWDPEQFMTAVERHKITIAFVVPTQMAMLLDHPNFSAARLKSLKTFIYGGAPATEELIRRAETAMPTTDIVQAFGSTETSHVLCQQPVERRAKPGSLGRPGPRIEFTVYKAPGEPAAPGEEGEIVCRGLNMFDYYLDLPEETAAYYKSGDGWGWTGDLGTVDEDGVVTLVGRKKEIIISGGMNISPVELENAIEDHPAVAACAAFGIPDETWGELPAAAVILKAGAQATSDEIMAHAAERVARFKRPRYLAIVDSMPQTLSGKVQRTALKEQFKDVRIGSEG